MYNKWQRAVQRINQNSKEFGVYVQLIWSNLLDLDKVGAPNETQLIHRIWQDPRSEICALLYFNSTVTKDLPTFFEDVARERSSIYLQHKSTSHGVKSSNHNKEKQADKPTDSNHSHGSSHNSQESNAQGNTQGQFKSRKGRESLVNHWWD